jgi:hypothetical protein
LNAVSVSRDTLRKIFLRINVADALPRNIRGPHQNAITIAQKSGRSSPFTGIEQYRRGAGISRLAWGFPRFIPEFIPEFSADTSV